MANCKADEHARVVADKLAPSRGVVTVEIVMLGASVRKARELHAARRRKPLLGERRASESGEIYLGEIS